MGFEILVTKCEQGGAGSEMPRWFFGDIIFLWSLNKDLGRKNIDPNKKYKFFLLNIKLDQYFQDGIL